ncbi:MAG: hypothetical protein N3D10_02945 [Candidatus Micrarchaeota archaeon]|nr:hypothetical protein [Candidatus Micrarchaeota archaeon]
MASIIVRSSLLNGSLTALSDDSLSSTLLVFLANNSGGVIGNFSRTKKVENLINSLNQLGADIAVEEDTADIFPILKKGYSVDLKNDVNSSKYIVGLSFFSGDKTKILNPKIPKNCKKALAQYAEYLGVRLLSYSQRLEIESEFLEKNAILLEGIEGSFFAPAFITGAAAMGVEFLVSLDDYTSKYRGVYNVANAFELLNYEYYFKENTGNFFVARKYSGEEFNLDLPPSIKFSMYYLGALLLSGKGKINFPTKLNYPEIKIMEQLSSRIKKTENFFEVADGQEQLNFPAQLEPQGIDYLIPLLFVLGTKSENPFKIGPFVPYRQDKLKKLQDFALQLAQIGAKIKYVEPYFEITPSKLYGGIIEPQEPYSAMACTIAGFICKSELKVKNIENIIALNKNFLDDLKKLNADIKG